MMKKEVHKTALEKKLEAELQEDAAADTPVPVPNGAHEEQDALAAELEERTAERDDLKDQLLRARAEFDNVRKRTQREVERIRRTAAEKLIRELLPVLDNLQRALQHAENAAGGLGEGVEMVLSRFHEVLAGQGLEPIPALGEAFDPNVHEALSLLPSDEYPADTVMEEYERGYRLGGEILRPAKVVVSSGPGPNGASEAGVPAEEGSPEAAAQAPSD